MKDRKPGFDGRWYTDMEAHLPESEDDRSLATIPVWYTGCFVFSDDHKQSKPRNENKDRSKTDATDDDRWPFYFHCDIL